MSTPVATREVWLALALGALVSLASPPAGSAPKTLEVCYEQWDPYIYSNDEGQMRGIAVDLLDAALGELGLSARYRKLPFKRCIAEIRAGESHIALPISAGREYLAHSRTVFAHWTLAAIVPTDSDLNSPVSLDALNDRRVLLINGYGYPPKLAAWARRHPRILTVTYDVDSVGLVPFRMLEFDRADVFIEDNYWSADLIEQHDLDVRVLEPALDSAVSVAGFREDLADLRDRVDAVLNQRGQAFRDQLFRQYTGFPEAYFKSDH